MFLTPPGERNVPPVENRSPIRVNQGTSKLLVGVGPVNDENLQNYRIQTAVNRYNSNNLPPFRQSPMSAYVSRVIRCRSPRQRYSNTSELEDPTVAQSVPNGFEVPKIEDPSLFQGGLIDQISKIGPYRPKFLKKPITHQYASQLQKNDGTILQEVVTSPELRYTGPENFPMCYNIYKASNRPVKKQNILSQLNVHGAGLPISRYMDDSAEKYSDLKTTRSVLEVLQDMSRKRMHEKDDMDDSSKRRKGLGGDLVLEGDVAYKPLFVPKSRLIAQGRKDQTTQTAESSKDVSVGTVTNANDPKCELRKQLARRNNEISASLSSSSRGFIFSKRKRVADTSRISNDLTGTDPSKKQKFNEADGPSPSLLPNTPILRKVEKPIVVESSPKSPQDQDRMMSIYLDMQNVKDAKINAIKAISTSPAAAQFVRPEPLPGTKPPVEKLSEINPQSAITIKTSVDSSQENVKSVVSSVAPSVPKDVPSFSFGPTVSSTTPSKLIGMPPIPTTTSISSKDEKAVMFTPPALPISNASPTGKLQFSPLTMTKTPPLSKTSVVETSNSAENSPKVAFTSSPGPSITTVTTSLPAPVVTAVQQGEKGAPSFQFHSSFKFTPLSSSQSTPPLTNTFTPLPPQPTPSSTTTFSPPSSQHTSPSDNALTPLSSQRSPSTTNTFQSVCSPPTNAFAFQPVSKSGATSPFSTQLPPIAFTTTAPQFSFGPASAITTTSGFSAVNVLSFGTSSKSQTFGAESNLTNVSAAPTITSPATAPQIPATPFTFGVPKPGANDNTFLNPSSAPSHSSISNVVTSAAPTFSFGSMKTNPTPSAGASTTANETASIVTTSSVTADVNPSSMFSFNQKTNSNPPAFLFGDKTVSTVTTSQPSNLLSQLVTSDSFKLPDSKLQSKGSTVNWSFPNSGSTTDAAKPLFGVPTTSIVPSLPDSSASGAPSTSEKKPLSVFARLGAPPSTQSFTFGKPSSENSAAVSSAVTAASSFVGFGLPSTASTQQQGAFGQSVITQATAPTTTSSTSTWSFGQSIAKGGPSFTATTTASTVNLFGATSSSTFASGVPAVSTTVGFGMPPGTSPFALGTTTASSNLPVYPTTVGTATKFNVPVTSSTPAFGHPTVTPTAVSSAPTFGQTTSIFGSTTTGFGAANNNGFGTTTTTSSGFAFGQTAAAPAASTFGQPSSVFAFDSGASGGGSFGSTPFGNPTTTVAAPTTQPPPFGTSASSFGSTVPQQTFGGGFNQPAGNFGQSGFGQKHTPAFGQQPASAAATTNTTFVFGKTSASDNGPFTFGSTPPATSAPAFELGSNKPAFGVTPKAANPSPFGTTNPPTFGTVPATSTPSAPTSLFTFGTANKTNNPVFNFGSAANPASTPSTPFAFGSGGASSGFNFNANPGSSAGNFSFSGSATPSAPRFGPTSTPPFGQPATPGGFSPFNQPSPGTFMPGTFTIGSGSTQPRSRGPARRRQRP